MDTASLHNTRSLGKLSSYVSRLVRTALIVFNMKETWSNFKFLSVWPVSFLETRCENSFSPKTTIFNRFYFLDLSKDLDINTYGSIWSYKSNNSNLSPISLNYNVRLEQSLKLWFVAGIYISCYNGCFECRKVRS